MLSLTIRVPKALSSKNKHQLEALAREALIVKLYEQGEISSGYAAEILGIPRRTFLDLLGDCQYPPRKRGGLIFGSSPY